MSITKFIRRVCVQDAVYWEHDGMDSFSNPKFKAPVEVTVRWDEKSEIVSDNNGREFVSRAQVLTPDNMVEQSYLRLGTIADLPAGVDEPRDIVGAWEVKKMDRHPLFKSKTLDVFIAYL